MRKVIFRRAKNFFPVDFVERRSYVEFVEVAPSTENVFRGKLLFGIQHVSVLVSAPISRNRESSGLENSRHVKISLDSNLLDQKFLVRHTENWVKASFRPTNLAGQQILATEKSS